MTGWIARLIEIDEQEALIVRRIFSECRNGASFNRISRALNHEGSTTPRTRRLEAAALGH